MAMVLSKVIKDQIIQGGENKIYIIAETVLVFTSPP